MIIILDGNVFISSIIRDSTTRKLILESDEILIFPEVIFDEIREHEKEILERSGLIKEDYEKLLAGLLKYVWIIPTEIIKPYKEEATKIIGEIDEDDVPFFATALAFENSVIWSDDKRIKKQDKIKVLNTQEIIELFKKESKKD